MKQIKNIEELNAMLLEIEAGFRFNFAADSIVPNRINYLLENKLELSLSCNIIRCNLNEDIFFTKFNFNSNMQTFYGHFVSEKENTLQNFIYECVTFFIRNPLIKHEIQYAMRKPILKVTVIQ